MQTATRLKKNLQTVRKQNTRIQKTTANKCLPWFLHQNVKKKENLTKTH